MIMYDYCIVTLPSQLVWIVIYCLQHYHGFILSPSVGQWNKQLSLISSDRFSFYYSYGFSQSVKI